MQVAPWSRAKLLRGFALDHGYATAEFAMILPAVLFIGFTLIWALSLFFTQLQIQTAAYSIARDIGRGQTDDSNQNVHLPHGFKLEKTFAPDYVTVKISVHKDLLGRRLPVGIDMSTSSVAELERSGGNQTQ